MSLSSRIRQAAAALLGSPQPPTESQSGHSRFIAGLVEYSGDFTPQRVAADLSAAARGNLCAANLLFDAMEDRDARLSAVASLRRSVAAGTGYTVSAAEVSIDAPQSDLDLADEIADAVQSLLWRVWTRSRRIEMADAIGKEFSLLEIYWTRHRTSGRVDVADDGLRYIDPTALVWYDAQARNAPAGVPSALRLRLQNGSYDGIPLTPYRYVQHVHPARPGRPGKRALWRCCALPVMLRSWSRKNWAAFAEIAGQPIRVGEYPSSFDANAKDEFEAALEAMGVSAYAMIPAGAKITIQESSKGGRGTTAHEALLDAMAEEITIAILGQTLTTSAGDLGSQALGKVHDKVRGDIRENDAELLCETIRRDLVTPYVIWNWGRADLVPHVTPESGDESDREKEMRVATQLHVLGVSLSVPQLREVTGYREPAEGEESLPGQQATGFGLQVPGAAFSVAGDEARATGNVPVIGAQQIEVSTEAVLNGAQIQAARQIVSDVAAGLMPRDAGLGQLQVLFNLTTEQAAQIMGSAGSGEWKPVAPAASPAQLRAHRPSLAQLAAERAARADRDQAVALGDQAAARPFDFAAWLRREVTTAGTLDAVAQLQTTQPPASLVDSLVTPLLLADLAGRASWQARQQAEQENARRLRQTRRDRYRGLRSGDRNRTRYGLAQAAGDSSWTTFGLRGVPAERAIANLRKRLALTPEQFDQISAAARKRAFTAAGLSSQTAIETLRNQVATAIENGRTYREFLDGLDAAMEQAGYAGERPSRVYQVYHDSVMSAYGAGQYEQAQETADDFPYWQYLATGGSSGDGRTRPEHRALHGKVFRLDDLQAAAFWPPWDHGCRCDARPMTAAMVEAEGLTVEGGAAVRSTPVTIEREGKTVIVTPVPRPEWDAPPDGRMEQS